MTTLSNILVPSNILTASNTCTVTNKTISGANNTLTVRMANDVSGTLPVANGGTGQTSYTDGQLLIGNTTGNTLSKNTLTAGTDIVITNGNGSISIEYVPPDVNSIYSWGCNSVGQLGDNTIVSRPSPVSVVGGYTDWCQVSGGYKHSVGVRTNGTAWSWGDGGDGRLGDNTTASKSSPVIVIGGFTDWCQVSAGDGSSLGVRQNGTAWGWGCNSVGQLGDNTGTARSSPVSVVGGFTDWCQIATNTNSAVPHSLAVRQNGTAWAWGSNSCGKLGDGTTTTRSSPVSVIGGFTDWSQVDAGMCQSFGVRTNGTLWSWGYAGTGVLGNGDTAAKSSPVSVVGGFTDWCQVSAGCIHTMAVRTGGTLWAWGFNECGQLGNNIAGFSDNTSPVSVRGGFTDWCQISAGGKHSLGVKQDGTAWGWGAGGASQLGDNTTDNKSSPVSVVGGFTDWCQVSAGFLHSLAIRSTVT